MKKLFLFVLPVILIGFVACSQTSQQDSNDKLPDNWVKLEENGFSIAYPNDWTVDKSGVMGMTFVILSEQTSQSDNFRENINLMIQDLTGMDINLDKYVEISEEQVKTMITNSILLHSDRLNANGKEFQRVIYTGQQGIFNLKFEQYYWVENNKAYILTLTCEQEQFDTYKKTGEQIIKSFQF